MSNDLLVMNVNNLAAEVRLVRFPPVVMELKVARSRQVSKGSQVYSECCDGSTRTAASSTSAAYTAMACISAKRLL